MTPTTTTTHVHGLAEVNVDGGLGPAADASDDAPVAAFGQLTLGNGRQAHFKSMLSDVKQLRDLSK